MNLFEATALSSSYNLGRKGPAYDWAAIIVDAESAALDRELAELGSATERR